MLNCANVHFQEEKNHKDDNVYLVITGNTRICDLQSTHMQFLHRMNHLFYIGDSRCHFH